MESEHSISNSGQTATTESATGYRSEVDAPVMGKSDIVSTSAFSILTHLIEGVFAHNRDIDRLRLDYEPSRALGSQTTIACIMDALDEDVTYYP
jgi:hypothetical protein